MSALIYLYDEALEHDLKWTGRSASAANSTANKLLDHCRHLQTTWTDLLGRSPQHFLRIGAALYLSRLISIIMQRNHAGEIAMDVTYFLKKRTDFIRFYYDTSVKPFETLKHQIEEGLPPFDDPPYCEDAEPPFLDEWMAADTATTVLGLSCLSMLSDSLKLYFQSLQKRVIGFDFENKKKAFEQGFPPAYKAALGAILDTDWKDCPADFDLIEQVVLARNRSQHGADLTSFRVHHDAGTLKKHPRPFFTPQLHGIDGK